MKLFKKSPKSDRLEAKASWRFIKVAYIVLASLVVLATVGSGVNNVSNCHESNDATHISREGSSRLAQHRLLENLQNGVENCDESEAQSNALVGVIVACLAGIATYFVIKSICRYVILGSEPK